MWAFVALVLVIVLGIQLLANRQREMAILRAMGARPRVIVGLLMLESVLMAAMGSVLGFALVYGLLILCQPLLDATFGLWLPIDAPSWRELLVLMSVIGTGAIVSALPAIRAYRMSLADGMIVRN